MRRAVLSRLEVPPAYAVVVEHLRRAIHLGTYAPGEKFPPERQHAEALGVSRVTLREAIRFLQAEGYIETRRGATGGATVVARTESPARLRERLRQNIDELLAIQEFRAVNERLAAERAATRLAPEDLAVLANSVQQMHGAKSVGEFRRWDSHFHLRIAAAAECALLREAIEEARAAMFHPLDALDYELMLADTLRAHKRILKALRDGDAARAGRAMVAHVRTTTRELETILR